ncbi:flagellin [Telmatospirillum sp. J64-1]|uniref:flagellin n=1 Tax=Telmatospirillum sp. J64-1 TaxID=2502183 RepID=UPI00115CC976|nr:flagellin [Telmatospirillum sp. J64-1]
MSSVLTNVGAMTALRTLQNTNANLVKTQDRVSTGMKVASAKDNAASWSIAATMSSDANAFKVMADGAGVAMASVGAALKAAEEIVETLKTIKGKVAQYEGASSSDQAVLASEISELAGAISDIASSANFNGVNLVNGTDSLTVKTGLESSDLTITGVDLSGLGDQTTLAGIDGDLDTAKAHAQTLGAAYQRLEVQQRFLNVMADSLTKGVGALVDADMTEESARLSALQVQQQLGAQALSIANQAPQTLLNLFR